MNTSEPHVGRHVAPKRHGHETVPLPRPISGYRTPSWDIFEPEAETWVDSWLTADDRRAYSSHGVAA